MLKGSHVSLCKGSLQSDWLIWHLWSLIRSESRAGPPSVRVSVTASLKAQCAVAGSLDADCPIWDHVVQLFVCCEDPKGGTSHCDECDVTPWMSMAEDGEPALSFMLSQQEALYCFAVLCCAFLGPNERWDVQHS